MNVTVLEYCNHFGFKKKVNQKSKHIEHVATVMIATARFHTERAQEAHALSRTHLLIYSKLEDIFNFGTKSSQNCNISRHRDKKIFGEGALPPPQILLRWEGEQDSFLQTKCLA